MRVSGTIMSALAVLALLTGCKPPDVSIKQTPVRVTSETVGIGRPAHAGDLVTINYRVRLANGREILRDGDYRFELGRSTVITAVDEAVQGMREHGRRTVESPPNKHWGRAGYGNGAIPPNVTLTIDIELLAID